MVLQLVIDKDGNYTYKDPRQKSINSEVQSQAFDAYEGNKNQDVIGGTNLAEQTKKILRETPGQYTTTFDEETGQFKTKVTGQDDTAIDVPQPTVGEVVQQTRETPMDRVSRIISATRPQPIDNTRVARLIEDRNKLLEREQNLNFTRDLVLGFLPKEKFMEGIGGKVKIPTTGLADVVNVPVGETTLGGAATAGAVAYGLTNVFKVKEKKGVTAGATVGSVVGGPVGAVVGGVVGGAVEAATGKVVCTAMYKTTGLEEWKKHIRVWQIFERKYLTPYHEKGYHILFKPFVKGMHKSNIIKALGAHVAKHRTQDLKHIMFNSKPSWIGRIYRKILEPICYLVGRLWR